MKATKPRKLTGMELDRRVREILLAATKDTVLSSAHALVELGLHGLIAFNMICKVIAAKEKGRYPHGA